MNFLCIWLIIVSMVSFMQSVAMEESREVLQEQPEQLFQLPEFPETPFPVTLNRLSELVGPDGSCQEKLGKLHILSNLVLAANQIYRGLKNGITMFDSMAVETSDAAHIEGFHILGELNKEQEENVQKNKDFNLITSFDDESEKKTVLIKSVKGKATFLQLLPLLDSKQVNSSYRAHESLINDYMQHTDPEVALLARFVKNAFCQRLRKLTIAGIADAVFYPIRCLKMNSDPCTWPSLHEFSTIIPHLADDMPSLANENFIKILDTWLEQKEMASLAETTIPHVLWAYKFFKALTSYTIGRSRNLDEMLARTEKSRNHSLSDSLKLALAYFDKTHKYSIDFYRKIMQMRARLLSTIKNPRDKLIVINKYNRLFLLGSGGQSDFDIVPQSLSNVQKSESSEDDYIPKSSGKKNAKKDNKKITKKGRKKNAKKNKKKKVQDYGEKEEEPEESLALQKPLEIKKALKILEDYDSITYDVRVLAWWVQAFLNTRNPNQESLIYHTYEPGVDLLVEKSGKTMDYSNKTHEGCIDTVYYAPAQFKYVFIGNVTATGPESNFNGIGQDINTFTNFCSGISAKKDSFSCHGNSLSIIFQQLLKFHLHG
jgi:hypothetical protein